MRNSRQRLNRRKAMTLVETVVVIGVMVAIIAILASAFSSLPVFQSTEDEAEILQSNLYFARKSALKSNRVVYLELNIEEDSYRMYRIDRTDEGIEEKELGKERELSFTHSIVSIQIGANEPLTEGKISIPFQPDGTSEQVCIYLGPNPEITRTVLNPKYGSRIQILEGEQFFELESDWEADLEDF